MVRHNWRAVFDGDIDFECAKHGNYCFGRNCMGCGATIRVEDIPGEIKRDTHYSNVLDIAWVRYLHPMAEFVTLVEEADDSTA